MNPQYPTTNKTKNKKKKKKKQSKNKNKNKNKNNKKPVTYSPESGLCTTASRFPSPVSHFPLIDPLPVGTLEEEND